jgi:photosystem II stability/assembly factor-like uncharacterized protein
MSILTSFDIMGQLWLGGFGILLLLSFFILYVRRYYQSNNIQKTQNYRMAFCIYYSLIVIFGLIVGAGIIVFDCGSRCSILDDISDLSLLVTPWLFLILLIFSVIFNIIAIREARKKIQNSSQINNILPSQMHHSKFLRISVLIGAFCLIALVFFYPKSNGGGGTCIGCENTTCKCFGFERTFTYIGPWNSTCYGIPHSCSTYKMGFENVRPKKLFSNEIISEKKYSWQRVSNVTGNLPSTPGLASSFYPGSLYFIDDQVGFILGKREAIVTSPQKVGIIVSQGSFLKTTDGGKTWKEKTDIQLPENVSLHKFSFLSIKFFDKNNGFIIGSVYDDKTSILVLQTTDGGENWRSSLAFVPVNEEQKGFIPRLLSFPSSNHIYSVDVTGNIVKYDAQSSSWTLLYKGKEAPLDIFFFNETSGHLIIGNPSFLLSTIDGGGTWNSKEINSLITHSSFLNYNVGYIARYSGDQKQLLKTVNGGMSWTESLLPINSLVKDLFFVDENIGYVITDTDEVIETNDGGKNWFKYQSTNPNGVLGENNRPIIFFKGLDKAYSIDNIGNLYKLMIE